MAAFAALAGGTTARVIVYVTPERIRRRCWASKLVDALRNSRVSFWAFDEAHAQSTWGRSFRPRYAQLGAHLGMLTREAEMQNTVHGWRRLDRLATGCFTGTASRSGVAEISRLAGLVNPELIIRPVVRRNLHLVINYVLGATVARRFDRMLRHLDEDAGDGEGGGRDDDDDGDVINSALVFGLTRATVASLSASFEMAGRTATNGHG